MPPLFPTCAPGNIKTRGIAFFHQNLEDVVRIFGPWDSRSGNFPGFENFEPKNFGFSNFRAKIFPARELSVQKFLGFENFEPKKIPENFDPGRSGHGRFTTGE
jgi:hypothetical protein